MNIVYSDNNKEVDRSYLCETRYLLGLHPIVFHHASIRILLLVCLDALEHIAGQTRCEKLSHHHCMSDMSLLSVHHVTAVSPTRHCCLSNTSLLSVQHVATVCPTRHYCLPATDNTRTYKNADYLAQWRPRDFILANRVFSSEFVLGEKTFHVQTTSYFENTNSFHDQLDTSRRVGHWLHNGDVILLQGVQSSDGSIHGWHCYFQLCLAVVLSKTR